MIANRLIACLDGNDLGLRSCHRQSGLESINPKSKENLLAEPRCRTHSKPIHLEQPSRQDWIIQIGKHHSLPDPIVFMRVDLIST